MGTDDTWGRQREPTSLEQRTDRQTHKLIQQWALHAAAQAPADAPNPATSPWPRSTTVSNHVMTAAAATATTEEMASSDTDVETLWRFSKTFHNHIALLRTGCSDDGTHNIMLLC